MGEIFNLYISTKYTNNYDQWINNTNSMYNKLSFYDKIRFITRQKFIDIYSKLFLQIQDNVFNSIFDDIKKDLDFKIKLLIKESQYKENRLYYNTLNKVLIVLNNMEEQNITFSIEDHLPVFLSMFLEEDNISNVIPSVGNYDIIKGLILFLSFYKRGNSSHIKNYIDEYNNFKNTGLLKLNYKNNKSVVIDDIIINSNGGSLDFNNEGYGVVLFFEYINSLDLSEFNHIKLFSLITNLLIIRDKFNSSRLQQLFSFINKSIIKYFNPNDMNREKCNDIIYQELVNFFQIANKIYTKYRVPFNEQIELYKYIIINYDKNIDQRLLSYITINEQNKDTLLKSLTSSENVLQNSYNFITKLNAADEEGLEDEEIDEDLSVEEDEEDIGEEETDSDLEDEDLGDEDLGDDDEDPLDDEVEGDDVSTEEGEEDTGGEPEPKIEHISEFDKKGIEMELNDGDPTLAELALREEIIKKLNKVLANPGNLPASEIAKLKYFKSHWIYLISVKTLMAIFEEIKVFKK